MKVRCNDCMSVFDENYIVVHENGYDEICPCCGQIGCLMDVSENEFPQYYQYTPVAHITKSMIHNGYKKGVVYLINNPNDDCIAANIGANWFYFAGSENENMTVKEYKEEYTSEEIVDYIFAVLDSDFKTEFEDEYLYYYYYLKECGC